ncbi:MAG: hypothetical protein V7641_4208 [Blastocatellia bacterium]
MINDLFDYKHCAPTELPLQKHFLDSLDSIDSLDSMDSMDSIDSMDCIER